MTTRLNRKRALVAGGALLLVAGVSAGGALVTQNSTILDNVFQTEASNPAAAEMLVTGDAMTHSFTGDVDGELITEYYLVENTSATNDLKFNVGTLIHGQGTNDAALAAALDTQIKPAGLPLIDTGKLGQMAIPSASQITVAAGDTIEIRVDVLVKDSAAFQAAGLGDADQVTVDFRFDSIFL